MKKLMFVCLLIAFSMVAAACGGGSAAVTLDVEMKEFVFEPDTLSVPAGAEVTLNLTNSGALDHNFIVMKQGVEVSEVWSEAEAGNIFFKQTQTTAGSSATATFTAPSEAGEYQILCSVPGHLEQGMVATLTVTP